MSKRIVVLCPTARRLPLYESWIDTLSLPVEMAYGYGSDYDLDSDVALLITHEHRRQPAVSLCCRAMEMNIPVLVVPDGILEFRNIWSRPDAIPASSFQPLLAHKVACFGAAQIRTLNAWGNIGKCENVGCPRLDPYIDFPERQKNDGMKRVLVMTANTPAFTPAQEAAVLQSLQDLLAWSRRSEHADEVELIWRITAGWEKQIGLDDNRFDERNQTELAELLQTVDAVITTPSTTLLESMLSGVPVARLDYTNSPAYVPAAWNINAEAQIDLVISGLLNPHRARMLFQQEVLHDELNCNTSASPRMVELIEQMLKVADNCRAAGIPLQFPSRLLNPEPDEPLPFPPPADYPDLFPENTDFPALPDYAALYSERLQWQSDYRDARRFRTVWRELGAALDGRSILLFGMGQFARRFLCAVAGTDGGPVVAGVMDDAAKEGQYLSGHAVRPCDFYIGTPNPSVFVLTDTHYKAMRSRCRQVFGDTETVYGMAAADGRLIVL